MASRPEAGDLLDDPRVARFESNLRFPTGGIVDEELHAWLNDRVLSQYEWGDVPVITCEFSKLQEYLEGISGFKVSQELVERLGFGSLEWRFFQDTWAGSLLFVGASEGNFDRKYRVSSAEATLLLGRRYYDYGNPIVAEEISVAGVDKTSGRILAATYNTADFFKDYGSGVCTDFAVSVYQGGFHPNWRILDEQAIPTSFITPHQTEGIITRKMVEATGDTDSRHTHVLRFYSFGLGDIKRITAEAFPHYLRVEQTDGRHVIRANMETHLSQRSNFDLLDGITIPLFLNGGN